MRLPARVTVVEVGPRDGLQNEPVSLSVDDRVDLCDRLVAAGLSVVEVGAFVSPRWVPQMAGSEEVLRRVRPRIGVRLPVLVPNRQGFDRARAAGAREIAVFTAASETFNRRNINATIDESFARFAEFLPEATAGGLRVRGYVSTCFGCPFEGRVAPEAVVDVARRLVAAGCDEVSIGDTIGVAVPTQVGDVIGQLLEAIPLERLAVHFHDTRGTALANVLAARGLRQPRDRGPPLHAPRNGDRDRGRPRRRGRGVLRRGGEARTIPSFPLSPGGADTMRSFVVVSADGQTLLVVDDLPANRELMARRLERSGFHVVLAGGGPEALAILSRQPIDMVLLDIMMPGMTGLDVLRQIRATRSAVALPVIMVTAKTDSEDVVEALALGANDYVTKPVDYPVALARIRAHLRTREAAQTTAAPSVEPLSPAQAVAGTVLGGRYRLDSMIGGGSFGTVFKARHLELDREVAVKVLATSAGTDPEALARFRREGASACRVQHPNAVAVLDFGVNRGGVAYLVMELLKGHSLEKELEDHGPLSPVRCAEIVIPVCAALAAAHAAEVLHRDIKPSNIFLHQTPQGEIVKILDFGIAKIAGAAAINQNLTVDGSLLGTPAYMAPERFRRGPYGAKSDVYSVGTMLYEMLAGRLPFIPPSADPLALVAMQAEEDPPPIRLRRRDVSPALDTLVRSALARNPEARPYADVLARRLALVTAEPFTPLDDPV
jgi:CheY-like chemotaxis protein